MTRNTRNTIDLDFTSLLDITLIILFFFILFSSFQSEKDVNDAQEKAAAVLAADRRAELAEYELEKEKALREELSAELEEIKSSGSESAEYSAAAREFAAGGNIKILYLRDGASWKLEVRRGERVVSYILRENDAAERFMKILEEEGYGSDSYIMCEFIYDRSQFYIEADNKVKAMIEAAGRRYRRLLVSYTNTSRSDN